MRKLVPVGFLLMLMVAVSCSKQSETLNTSSLSDYFPLVIGKTLFYRLDSTVIAPFGTALIVRSYLAKDSIESSFVDNQGRKSYRIFRFLRDTLSKQPWTFSSTFFATPTNESVEWVENNMRFIKLHLPIKDDYSFKAHSYIDTKSLSSTVNYLDEWEYSYQNVGQPYSLRNRTFDSTVTVLQHDETSPPGPFNPNNYQQRNFGTEVYAKGLGLIYKEFLHWTWQTTPAPAKYEDGSYGVKLTYIGI